MRLRLLELQEWHEEVRKFRAAEELHDGYEDIDGVLHHHGLPFVPEIFRTELISRHHDDPLAGHFGIDTWPSLRKDVEAYGLRRLFGFESGVAQALR